MNILGFILNVFVLYNVIKPSVSADQGVCYPSLGCFNITNDFKSSPIYRPINLLPESPDKLTTKFIFYTQKSDKNNGLVLGKKWISSDRVSDKLDNFDGNKETKFIIHGFLDDLEIGHWMQDMKDEFLTKGDYNVFIVDWSQWNKMPYSQAVANTRVIGAQIALLIKNLNNSQKLKYNLVHLIGHSLGAHLAGYAGKSMKKYSAQISRITGLDPAEPYFQNMPITVRLDRTDADFVDILHTDSKSILQGGLGMSQAIGHIDFYPNGGNDQPGCSQDRISSLLTGTFLSNSGLFVACNHMRSTNYFTESINGERKNCQFTGYSCDSWTKFNTKSGCNKCGKSGANCAQMGLNAIQWKRFKSNKRSKRFYLKTNSKTPFCGKDNNSKTK